VQARRLRYVLGFFADPTSISSDFAGCHFERSEKSWALRIFAKPKIPRYARDDRDGFKTNLDETGY